MIFSQNQIVLRVPTAGGGWCLCGKTKMTLGIIVYRTNCLPPTCTTAFFLGNKVGDPELVQYTMLPSVIFVFRHKHHPPPAVGTLSTIWFWDKFIWHHPILVKFELQSELIRPIISIFMKINVNIEFRKLKSIKM